MNNIFYALTVTRNHVVNAFEGNDGPLIEDENVHSSLTLFNEFKKRQGMVSLEKHLNSGISINLILSRHSICYILQCTKVTIVCD